MNRTHEPLSRRDMFRVAGATAAASVLASAIPASAQENKEKSVALKGNIKQAASKWCYGRIPLDEFCAKGKALGMVGVDLLNPGDFATLKKYDMVCTMVSCNGIPDGFNRKENHAKLIENLKKAIDATSEAGYPNVICFSGNRKGMDDAEGARNCIEGLKQVVGYAEQKKVTLCMELLNSKVNHKDYMCDRTHWGVEVCKGVGSDRFKLLYDIYHMQIQEGDVIATIKQFKDYIGHVHTGGVPGRNEIDDTQELYYPAIMKTLLNVGYKGYVAHEFIPKRDPLTSLAQAIQICDV